LAHFNAFSGRVAVLCRLRTECGIKSNPLDLLAVFSATAGNFDVKFYTLIYSSCTYMQVSTAFNCRTLS